LLSVTRIWDNAEHNALTDLIRYKNKWFCTFRESDAHVYGRDGAIRILSSPDGIVWSHESLLVKEGVDLRDPKLSVTPYGRLMLLVGGISYQETNYISRHPLVAFSEDGSAWGEFHDILQPHEWLWRLTWFEGKGYGVSYSFSDPQNWKKKWNVKLFSTDDGLKYQQIVQWEIPGHPNETTLRFDNSGKMIALVRREGKGERKAWIGTSIAPYTDWYWNETNHHIGGPNFLILPNGKMLAAGRVDQRTPYGYYEKTALLDMTEKDLYPIFYLPSGGVDCSYPGMVYDQELLWVSYYSSHEEKTAIYFAKLKQVIVA
jgi:hypothetical protein